MQNPITRNPDLRELGIFVLLVFAVFLVRSLFTNMPEIADAVKKWDIAVGIANTHDFSLLLARDHHSARWGIVLPVALFVKILGANLTAYYSICLIQYAIIFGFLYSFARRDIATGLLLPLAVLLFFEPMFFRATTQIQPFIFGVFYIVVALFLLQKHLENGGKLLLILAALFCFFAYGAKETYLFFVVGAGVLVLWRGSLLSAIAFGAVLLGLLFAETVVFNSLSDNLTFGRIEYLTGGKHQAGMMNHAVAGWGEMLARRWNGIPAYSKLVCMVGFGSGILLFVTGRMNRLCSASQGMVLCMASYAVLVSITPQSLDPLIPIQPLKSKYITPVIPFMAFVSVLGMDQLLRLFGRSWIRRWGYIGANAAALTLVAYTFSDDYPHKYRIKTSQWATVHPSAEAIYWKHNSLADGLTSDTGVCASRTAPLRWANLFLIKFFNSNGSAERMHVSRPGNRRILHSTDLSLEDLDRFVLHDNLFEFVELEECPEKRQKLQG